MSGVGGDIWADVPEYKSPSPKGVEAGHGDIWADVPDYSPEAAKAIKDAHETRVSERSDRSKAVEESLPYRLATGVTGGAPKTGGDPSDPESWWPYRLAKGLYEGIHSAVTAPGDVLHGQLDPMSPEGIRRASEFANIASPGVPGVRGRLPPSPALEAARSSVEAGQGLPRGTVSPNPLIRMGTGLLEKIPYVGAPIKEGAAKSIGKVGESVESTAKDLAGGTLPLDRAEAGGNLRPGIESAIENNKARINDAYDSLRSVTDTTKPAELTETTRVLNEIRQDRRDAGKQPNTGLEDVVRLVEEGGTRGHGTTKTELKGPGFHIAEDIPGEPLTHFNGLQRARNDIGHDIAWGKTMPGYNQGDLKNIYRAMSADMRKHVEQNRFEGVPHDLPGAALNEAHDVASKIVGENAKLTKLGKIESDEGLISRVAAAAKGKDARLVEQLRKQLPKEDFDAAVGGLLHEMGHDADKNAFSFDKFAKEWGKLSPTAKKAMFPDAAHRQRLEGFANMSKLVKAGDLPVSAAGGAVAGGALAEGGLKLAKTAISHGFKGVAAVLGAVGGGRLLARALAKPATAATVDKWNRALFVAERSPSATTRAALTISTRNLMNTLEDVPGFSKKEFLERLKGPT